MKVHEWDLKLNFGLKQRSKFSVSRRSDKSVNF